MSITEVSYLGDKDARLIDTKWMTGVVRSANNAKSKWTTRFPDHHGLKPTRNLSHAIV